MKASTAAKKCKGRKKGAFLKCVRKHMRKGRKHHRKHRR
jgi:hypothetical protein